MIDILKILAGAVIGWYLGGLLFDLWRKHEQKKERKRLEKLRDAMSKSATDAFTSTYNKVYQEALGNHMRAQQNSYYWIYPSNQTFIGTRHAVQAPIETTFEVLKSEPKLLTEGEPNGDKPVQ